MIKREVIMPQELIEDIAGIVDKENYLILKEAFPLGENASQIFLSEIEAESLVELAVIEKKKARLKYPFYDDEHPNYSEEHERMFDDVQMGIYEKTLYYIESAFKKGAFDHLL